MSATLHVVAVLGSRAGGGKSTLSRMLSLGAGVCGFEVTLISGDSSRPASHERSPYYTVLDACHGSSDIPLNFIRVVETVTAMKEDVSSHNRLIVIDGDSAWDQPLSGLLADEVPIELAILTTTLPDRTVNEWMSVMADLTLLPVVLEPSSIFCAKRDWLTLSSNARLVLNRVKPEPRLHAILDAARHKPAAEAEYQLWLQRNRQLEETLPAEPALRVYTQRRLFELLDEESHPCTEVIRASMLLWLQAQMLFSTASPPMVNSKLE